MPIGTCASPVLGFFLMKQLGWFLSGRLKIEHMKGGLCVCMYGCFYTSPLNESNEQGFSFNGLRLSYCK